MSKDETICLYLIVFFLSIILIRLSQRKINGKWTFKVLPFIISFILLWVISCFTKIGADYDNYYRIIEKSSYILEENGIIECVFNATCSFLYNLLKDSDKVIFILKTLTLFIYFRVMYLIRDRTFLWMSMLAFTLISFLEFYLISMHLAISFFMLAIVYLLDGDTKKFIIYYIIACLIHSTSILFLPVVALYFLFKCYKQTLTRMQIILIASMSLLVYALLTVIYTYATTKIQFFMHYAGYEIELESKGSGLFLFVSYVPILLLAISIYKSHLFSCRLKNIFILYSIFFFLFGLVSYKVQVFGRMSNYAIINYMMFIPIYSYVRNNAVNIKRTISKQILVAVWTIYLLLQGMITFNSKVNSDTSQLDKWEYCMPFS